MLQEAFLPADQSLPLLDWTVGRLLENAATRAPGRVALKQCGASGQADLVWTYDVLLADSRRMAGFLLTRFEPGERVGIWASNRAEWTLYQLAAAIAGLVLVTFNPALRAREMRYLLRHSGVVGLIMDRDHRGVDLTAIANSLRPDLPVLRDILLMDDWRAHLESASARVPSEARPGDPALVVYTSGTTGKPKGVVLHHRGLVNNANMGSHRYGLEDGLVWLNTLPCFHVGGALTATLGCIARLSTHIVMPAFEPGLVLGLLQSEGVAWLPTVPTMLMAMMEHETFPRTDLSKLRVALTGGTMVPPELVRAARDRFGVDMQVMFGQTESGGGMTKTLRSDAIGKVSGSVGIPYPWTDMKISRTTGDALAVRDEIGEIRVKSPFVMLGYLDDPIATAAAFDTDGYLRTGDLGAIDVDGYLRVTGRLKEMIIRGGENIYPREIEDALVEYPGIAEAAVIGVPHPRWGEEVAAVVRPMDGADCDFDAMADFLRARVARHKVPKLWRSTPDFPRTASGKIRKVELAAWFAEER